MKAAFHFDVGGGAFGNLYGQNVEDFVFSKIRTSPELNISSKIYVGDLLLHILFGAKDFEKSANLWVKAAKSGWHCFTPRTTDIFQTDVFILCFDSVEKKMATMLHDRLTGDNRYLGAIEIDDTNRLHWGVYSDALRLEFRVTDSKILMFYDAFAEYPSDEEKDSNFKRFLKIGFATADVASSEGKHSIFDKYHSFEQARRIAKWRSNFGDLLAFVADNVISKLGDPAPKLGEILWAAYNAYDGAETTEEFAHACLSCRRTIEYIVDTLFPPCETAEGERKLGQKNYRNRLLKFAEAQGKSGTNIQVVISSFELWAHHIEKLEELANKGIHADEMKDGTRRCLLRTVMLLDDVASINSQQPPLKTELDFSALDPK